MGTFTTLKFLPCVERRGHETRRLARGHVDGVEATWHRVDAIDASEKARDRTRPTRLAEEPAPPRVRVDGRAVVRRVCAEINQ